jgi:predicted nucleic acid-binding protein
VRTRNLTVEEARAGADAYDRWLVQEANPVAISAADISIATTFLRRLDLNLRAPDAIHIAMAMRLGATLATFDEAMAACARALGLPVASL